MPNGGDYAIRFHPGCPGDLEGLPANVQRRILAAIEQRLARAPAQYGERLRQSLRGYWKLRVGDYRVVFDLAGREVRVYGIMNRRDVYAEIPKRTSRRWPEEPPPAPRR